MTTVTSLGGGRQSIYMSYNYPTDLYLFADTGSEPQYVYDQLQSSRINYHTVSTGNLMQDVIDYINGKRNRVAQLPFFTETGLLMRQCTSDYKIVPIRRYLRSLKDDIGLSIGISLDEIQRMKSSGVKYITNHYPLIDDRITIAAIMKWYKDNKMDVPLRSACVCCPFHNNNYWKALKEKHPLEFNKVCEFDVKIRNYPKLRQRCYIHRSLKPLHEIDFDSQQMMEFPDLIDECDGLCGL